MNTKNKKKPALSCAPLYRGKSQGKKTTPENPDFKPGQYDYLNEIAYIIEDKSHGTFEVRKTANAWWMDKIKVEKVIEGKRLALNDVECCCYSGITKAQLDYFLQVHPHFCEFFEALPMYPRVRAKITIVKSLDDLESAQWYAERKMKDEFGIRTELTGRNGVPLVPQKLDPEHVVEIAKAALMTSGTGDE